MYSVQGERRRFNYMNTLGTKNIQDENIYGHTTHNHKKMYPWILYQIWVRSRKQEEYWGNCATIPEIRDGYLEGGRNFGAEGKNYSRFKIRKINHQWRKSNIDWSPIGERSDHSGIIKKIKGRIGKKTRRTHQTINREWRNPNSTHPIHWNTNPNWSSWGRIEATGGGF